MTKNPYQGAIDARHRAELQREMKRRDDQLKREAEIWKERAEEAVLKAEFAYEVIRAILPELRRGKPVSKPALTTAWQRLDDLPDKMKAILAPEDGFLDREMRREKPYKED